jgi:Pyridoxamine 5'-phosphate oxidase
MIHVPAISRWCDIVFPAAARRAQAERGSAHAYEKRIAAGFPDRVTPELAAFIAELDTAFLATASAGDAPYIQHRGGPKGFIKVLDEKTLAFADYAGNRQYITRATSPRTIAPTYSCSTLRADGGSNSGAARAWSKTTRHSSRGSSIAAIAGDPSARSCSR